MRFLNKHHSIPYYRTTVPYNGAYGGQGYWRGILRVWVDSGNFDFPAAAELLMLSLASTAERCCQC